ncbi:MAG: hypothetical protein ABSD98_01020 [Candidatus Korobacteraceae bacterium]|jgi:hypothetical protein
MAKTEVYSWRLDPDVKMGLEEEARLQGTSLAEFLDRTAHQVIRKGRRKREDDEAEQARLHAAAAKYAGSISGGAPHGSERVREVVRKRIRERNAH